MDLSEEAKNYVFKNGAFVGKIPFDEMFNNHTIIQYMQQLTASHYDWVTSEEINIYNALLQLT